MHRKFKLDLHLPKYSGDQLAWPEFWELYAAAVDQNTCYSAVEKFVFLRGYLTLARTRCFATFARAGGGLVRPPLAIGP